MPASQPPDELTLLWRFARGDMPAQDFERTLYDSPSIEAHTGRDLYLDLLATNFSDTRAMADRRYELHKHLDQRQRFCECITVKDHSEILWCLPVEQIPELATLEILRSRTPWLHLERCRVCDQHWYVAEDTVDDRIQFYRLSAEDARDIVERDDWPATFDSFDHVWPDKR
jgi:hypothetical protein